jgi:uncharacterized protein YlxW (UPF0749 family)
MDTESKCSVCGTPITLYGLSTYGSVSQPLCRECFFDGKQPGDLDTVDIEDLLSELTKKNDRLEEIEGKIEDMTSTIDDLRDEQKELRSEIERLEEEVSKREGSVAP